LSFRLAVYQQFDSLGKMKAQALSVGPPANGVRREASVDSFSPAEVLIVDDEAPIREMIAYGLSKSGFLVREAADSAQARTYLEANKPRALLVDWMLPDISGLELTRTLKVQPRTRQIPLIMLTARAAEEDKVAALEAGADDYVTKPFSSKELAARIHALLRRVAADQPESQTHVGGLVLDRAAHRISFGERTLALQPTQYRLLEFLMEHSERSYSRRQLLESVSPNIYLDERTIDVQVRRLRTRLAVVGCSGLVQTVHGVGYRLSTRAPT
jgi:two-component system, OmpR family, phosphate regulon response regulator PhoB